MASTNSTTSLVRDLQELLTLLSAAPRAVSPQALRRIELIREKIPKRVMEHFERLRIRGKKPLAPVRHSVCTACHLRIPQSHVLSMIHSEEIDCCDNCGTLVYLDDADKSLAALRSNNPVRTDEAPAPASRPTRHAGTNRLKAARV